MGEITFFPFSIFTCTNITICFITLFLDMCKNVKIGEFDLYLTM